MNTTFKHACKHELRKWNGGCGESRRGAGGRAVRERGEPAADLGGVRGAVTAGQGKTGHASLGYSLVFPWVTVGLRGRVTRSEVTAEDGALSTEDMEIGLGLVAQRFVDLDWFSVSLGIMVEGVYRRQTFHTEGTAPDRQGAALGFGGILGVERPLSQAVSVRLEGGPISQIMRQRSASVGTVETTAVVTPLTYWSAAGLVWRF